jgi:putative ABC transport system substrate-binding protein
MAYRDSPTNILDLKSCAICNARRRHLVWRRRLRRWRAKAIFEGAFASLVGQGAGIILKNGPIIFSHRAQVVTLAARASSPMLYEWRDFVGDGGLMSYGTDRAEVARQAGIYAGRILKGEKVSNMPVIQPTKFELLINLKTAKALGLTVPPGLLVAADEVIE